MSDRLVATLKPYQPMEKPKTLYRMKSAKNVVDQSSSFFLSKSPENMPRKSKMANFEPNCSSNGFNEIMDAVTADSSIRNPKGFKIQRAFSFHPSKTPMSDPSPPLIGRCLKTKAMSGSLKNVFGESMDNRPHPIHEITPVEYTKESPSRRTSLKAYSSASNSKESPKNLVYSPSNIKKFSSFKTSNFDQKNQRTKAFIKKNFSMSLKGDLHDSAAQKNELNSFSNLDPNIQKENSTSRVFNGMGGGYRAIPVTMSPISNLNGQKQELSIPSEVFWMKGPPAIGSMKIPLKKRDNPIKQREPEGMEKHFDFVHESGMSDPYTQSSESFEAPRENSEKKPKLAQLKLKSTDKCNPQMIHEMTQFFARFQSFVHKSTSKY